MKQYKVTKGIFKGFHFYGTEINIGGEKRVWNNNSKGQSFPLENCIEKEHPKNGLFPQCYDENGHDF